MNVSAAASCICIHIDIAPRAASTEFDFHQRSLPSTSVQAPMALKHYQVVGRKTPTEADPTPGLFRMHLFAPNTVVAKSRFW